MSGVARLPAAPPGYNQRDQNELRRAIETFLAGVQGLASAASSGGTGGGVTLPIAESDVTGLVADLATLTGGLATLTSGLAAKQAAIARATVTVTTASLANNATETGVVALAKAGAILSVVADRACWVRLYASNAERTADAGRLITADPANTVPVLAELIFTASVLTINCAPLIWYANRDGSPATDIYYSIKNLSGGTHTVQVGITHDGLEG